MTVGYFNSYCFNSFMNSKLEELSTSMAYNYLHEVIEQIKEDANISDLNTEDELKRTYYLCAMINKKYYRELPCWKKAIVWLCATG